MMEVEVEVGVLERGWVAGLVVIVEEGAAAVE